MTIEEALTAARKRDSVRVLDGRSQHFGKSGKIHELLGERFHTRGEPRAWIELDEDPAARFFIIVPLVHLEKVE